MSQYEELKNVAEQVTTNRRFCGDENHKFLAEGVLDLIADNASLKGSCASLGAEHAGMARALKTANRLLTEANAERDLLKAGESRLQGELHAASDLIATYRRVNRELRSERDKLKGEVETLQEAMRQIMNHIDGNIREAVRDCVNGQDDVQDIYEYCDDIEAVIGAALSKGADQ